MTNVVLSQRAFFSHRERTRSTLAQGSVWAPSHTHYVALLSFLSLSLSLSISLSLSLSLSLFLSLYLSLSLSLSAAFVQFRGAI